MLDFFLGRSASSFPASVFSVSVFTALTASPFTVSFSDISPFGGTFSGDSSFFFPATGFELSVFPPLNLFFTISITSSSMALLAVFFIIFFSFRNSITSLDCIFNSFAISYILTFAICCYLRYSVSSAIFNFSIRFAANPSSNTARLARYSLPMAWPNVSFGA